MSEPLFFSAQQDAMRRDLARLKVEADNLGREILFNADMHATHKRMADQCREIMEAATRKREAALMQAQKLHDAINSPTEEYVSVTVTAA